VRQAWFFIGMTRRQVSAQGFRELWAAKRAGSAEIDLPSAHAASKHRFG
jgi:hypothetical protein